MIGGIATSDHVPGCCCAEWVAGLAREHAGRMAAIARREGVAAADVLDVVQDAFQTLLQRPEVERVRERPDEAARLLAAIVRNAARNARRRHRHAKPHHEIDEATLASDAAGPEAAVGNAETAAQLVGCMARLGEV